MSVPAPAECPCVKSLVPDAMQEVQGCRECLVLLLEARVGDYGSFTSGAWALLQFLGEPPVGGGEQTREDKWEIKW